MIRASYVKLAIAVSVGVALVSPSAALADTIVKQTHTMYPVEVVPGVTDYHYVKKTIVRSPVPADSTLSTTEHSLVIEKSTNLDNSVVIKKTTEETTVDNPTVVEKVVERPVYIDRVVEKPVVIEKTVEKPVVVEKEVMVPQPVVVEKRSRRHLLHLGLPLCGLSVF